MLLNFLILPITQSETILSFFTTLEDKPLDEWPQFLAGDLLYSYQETILYLVQLTFLSVGFWLLDLPHLVVRSVRKLLWRGTRANDRENFVDNYAFDLGYHAAYSLTVFAIGCLYGPVVPLVPCFCIIFFCFKYCVDKYNLSFVYRTEF